ncbi:MAG: DNA mismatch endonuclease Vsr [Bacteroidales bacterium]|nr:DNA mismatch endonuclease Vsr [Bacteroidales bacterium]
MSDIYSKSKRSEIMSKISGKETSPEILVRKYLFAKGFRYRKNVKDLPGKPDIVLRKYNTIIFVHGCFWHGHTNCNRASLPASNRFFWQEKIGKNILRDKQNTSDLMAKGWRVIIIWQCEIRNKKMRESRLDSLIDDILYR